MQRLILLLASGEPGSLEPALREREGRLATVARDAGASLRLAVQLEGDPLAAEAGGDGVRTIRPLHGVVDLTVRAGELGQDRPLERELALVKVAGKGDSRVEALRLADAFRASVIDANTEHFIFEITGKGSKVDQFIAIMKPLGLVEICRTGVAAMNRGPQGM